jgi:N-acyl-D-aspartate/D-glutamate deacylase
MIIWLLLLLVLPVAAQDFDLLVRNGRIADGTGNPVFQADIGIRGDRIVAMGALRNRGARRTIDASGLVVAPGFIDMHNHSDNTILVDGNGESMVRQGVTSMIFGEGGSAAPSKEYPRFTGYFKEVLKRGTSMNLGSYVGSSEVWTHIRGAKAGPPTSDELNRMRDAVRQAMKDGALGVASSLSGPPGNWIDTATLVAMCSVAGEYGGIYSTHMRTEGKGVFEAVAEAMDIAKRAKVPLDIIHIKIAEHTMWGQMPELIASLQAARSRGEKVQANVYPYRAGQNNLSSIIPPWAHEGGSQALIARLKDPSLGPRLEKEILNGIPGSNWYNHYTATGSWDGMLLARIRNPKYQRFQGKRMSDVIRELGKPPVDVLFELIIENGGSVPTVYFHHSEEDMQYALKQPFVSIGSDGTAVKPEGPLAKDHPHPRYYGTFPRILGRYVRELKVISLEEAVRKMTSANAAKVSLYDRGLLRPGFHADVTIFDPQTIIDKATFENPHQYAIGVEYVIVNGVTVLEKGKHTGSHPGQILYGPGHDGGKAD